MFYILIYIDQSGQFRYKMMGNNHEPLGDNYTKLESAKDTLKLIKAGAHDAPVFFKNEDGSLEQINI